jgi:hypothetical protein
MAWSSVVDNNNNNGLIINGLGGSSRRDIDCRIAPSILRSGRRVAGVAVAAA